jgi:hypothetical protein
MTLTLPQEWVARLNDAAQLKGKTPEELALEGVESMLAPQLPGSSPERYGNGETSLLTMLGKYVGIVAGTGESLSEDCGRKFADGLASGKAARP